MTEGIERAMGVVVVVVDRRGWFVGGSFRRDRCGPLGLANWPVSDLARNWHDEDEEDDSGR
jgi:hypothetical protein